MEAYRFPRCKFYKNIERTKQKLEEELGEILELDGTDPEYLKEEILDLIHVCETYLQGLGVSDSELSIKIKQVEKKNRQRGYY